MRCFPANPASYWNSYQFEALTNQFAVFGRRLHAAEGPAERVRLIFQAMLPREPTAQEMEMVLAEIEQNGEKKALDGVVWALLNTQQFLFVQ